MKLFIKNREIKWKNGKMKDSTIRFDFNLDEEEIGFAVFGSDSVRRFLQTNPQAIGHMACCFLRSCCDLAGDIHEERELIAAQALAEFHELVDTFTDTVRKTV
ncbi:MAG: hypothetical protein L3J13_01480 [Devosiaceae bacterium]|nr:hypothetical protein [Devosiaceae bacterium]